MTKAYLNQSIQFLICVPNTTHGDIASIPQKKNTTIPSYGRILKVIIKSKFSLKSKVVSHAGLQKSNHAWIMGIEKFSKIMLKIRIISTTYILNNKA